MNHPCFHLERIDTPIGAALVVTDESGRLRALDWHDCEPRMRRLLGRHYGPAVTLRERTSRSGAALALAEYFAGHLDALGTVPVETAGTPFQRDVWSALRRIPAGSTLSYGALASRIGRPAAVRAVGLANGANPIGIVVPCHRVVGGNGALTGYAGGIERKQWLLAHEAAHASTPAVTGARHDEPIAAAIGSR
jgi:methylated-DNA-[protein]-cysteine S-methyltransferase